MSTPEQTPPSGAVPIPPSTSTPVGDVVTEHETYCAWIMWRQLTPWDRDASPCTCQYFASPTSLGSSGSTSNETAGSLGGFDS